MKKIVIISLLSLFTITGKAIEAEKLVKSKPEKVTVYLQGAQVFRTSTVNIPAGQSTIVFEGLETTIDQQSIQASGTGNFIITEIQYLVHYPELNNIKTKGDNKFNKTIKAMNDSLTLLNYEIENITNQRDVLSTEKSVLLNYGLYKGLSKKDSIALLKDGLTFLREKLNNINSELLRLKKDEAKFQLKISSINERLQSIYNEQNNIGVETTIDNKPDYRVIVSVIADAAVSGTMNINYFVPNAGWAPMYDLRTESVDKPMQLTYKAMVYQNTGADWKEVKLTLSTANPKQTFNIPVLNPYYVDAHNYNRRDYDKKKYRTYGEVAPAVANKDMEASKLSEEVYELDVVSKNAYDFVVMDENVIQAEFEIKLPYTIPSDNKSHYVSILNKELKTKYIHKTIPKLDLNAYLTARITDYEELNLLPGNANVFFDGTFVGKTYIQTGETGDTLELSLGQDKNVTVKRTKVKDKSKEKVMDNDKIYTVSYEIVVKNGNTKNIEIEVLDQLPLAQNKQVTIIKENISGAEHNELTGTLLWRNTIKAKDSKKITFTYQVKAPKDMLLAVK